MRTTMRAEGERLKRKWKAVFLALVAAAVGAAPLAAQNGGTAQGTTPGSLEALSRELDGGSAAWLMLEQGRVALERGELGVALAAFLKAKEAVGRDVYPEADIALGDVWRAEGELAQAERSYRKALDDLRIAENLAAYKEYDYRQLRYLILEKLADLYRLRENYGGMEEQYRAIVQADPDFNSGSLAERIERNFLESGLNKVLTLYRLSSGFARRAHAELGWLYYKTGRYEKAIAHGLYAVVNILSTVLRELRSADPGYTFMSVETTLRDCYDRSSTRAFLAEAEAWKSLYYLAAQSFAANHVARAREIWEVLQRSTQAGMYQGLAAKQLARPWIEPPLAGSYRGQPR